MGYTKDTIKGFTWYGFFRIIARVISFGRIAIIARILSPTQFGLVGIASLVLALLEIFTDTGINIFLIQQKGSYQKYLNTAWIVSIIRGFVIALIIFLLTPVIVNFFNTPDAYNLLLLISVVPLIRGFINPSVVKFQKELQFHKEFYFRSTLLTIEALTAIILVVTFQSPMAIVGALIVSALVEVILSFIYITPRPKFRLNTKLLQDILRTSRWLTAGGIFNYLYHHGDDIIVGKILGTASLGLYDMVYRISLLPITEVGDVVSRTTLPVYVRIGDDRKRLKKAFLKTIGAVTLLTLPVGAILFFFPEQLIRIALGPQWLTGAGVLQILSIFGVFRAILYAITMVFLACKKEHIPTIISFISLIGMAITIIPFIHLWGLFGAGVSVFLGTLITFPYVIYHLYKLFRTENV